MELPYLEDIYDFGEEDLNHWKEKVGKALSDYIPGSNAKWEGKARRVLESIQTELDERISINQISMFCFKELNSKLYKEVEAETPAMSDTQGSETAETASNLPSEASVASTGWLQRQQMSKKDYQQFIRDKLKSTQVSTGVVIGGSSVPQTKPARTKSTERTKSDIGNKVKRDLEKPGRKLTSKGESSVVDTRTESRNSGGKSRTVPLTKAGKPKEETKSYKSPGERRGKEQGAALSPPQKSGKLTTETVKKTAQEQTHGGKKKLLKELTTSSEESDRKSEGKQRQDPAQKLISASPRHQNAQEKDSKAKKETQKSASKSEVSAISDRAEDKTVKEVVGISEAQQVPSERPSESSSEGEERLEEERKAEEYVPAVQPPSEKLSRPQSSTQRVTSPPPQEAAKPALQPGGRSISPDAFPETIQTPISLQLNPTKPQTEPIPSHIEPPLAPTVSNHTSGDAISPFTGLSAISLEQSSLPTDEIAASFQSGSLFPSHSSVSSNTVPIGESKAGNISEGESGEEVEEAEEVALTFSVGRSVVTETSNLPPVTLKPRQKPLEPIAERQEETKEVNLPVAETKKPDSTPKSGGLKAPSKDTPETGNLKTEAAKKPPRSSIPRPPKPVPKPKPPPRVPTAPSEDYSDIYHTIADLFNGGKLKDFDLISAVRNCLAMFQDLEEQMSAPDFEFQRSFKFALAPLEMNPRDFLRNGGHFEMDALPKPPSDTEMYYRVVRAKQEVYDIVTRSFLKKPGWTELPHGMSLRCSWNIMWTWSKPRVDFGRLLVWQRVNHFPNSKQFSRKDNLKRNIERVAKQNAKCALAWNIIPATFILPKEYVAFCDEFAKGNSEEGNFWIMKPVGKSRGRGISLIKDITEVAYSEPMVIQKYLKHPLLLGGFKFDLRIYVLITSINPLEVFLYKEGFARMSTTQYTLNPEKLGNKFVHLTNSSIQKHNHSSQGDALDHSFGGTKISLETLRQRLKFQGVDFEAIWQQIREIIIKSMLAVQYEMENTPSCFDLVGYDILIDANLKAWLIEINSSPSLARDNVLDDMVKQTLIDDTLDLVNPLPFNRKKLVKVLERRLAELQKGNVGSVTQLNADVTEVLGSNHPRKYGELPEKLGNYERIAPSPLLDQFQKLLSCSKPSS